VKWLGKFPDPFIGEIAGQPDALRRAAAGLPGQRAATLEIADAAGGRAIVFTGMGSSYDACYPAVTELARAGVIAVMVDASELLHFRSAMLDATTLVVAVSQSGESAEVVRLARALTERSDRPFLVAVTNGLTNTLSPVADVVLDTRAGAEAGPSTMTFAASLVCLAALAGALAGGEPDRTIERVGREAERTARAIEDVLEDDELPGRLADLLGDRRSAVILGRGPARAAAEMGALTLKEAAGIAIESLQTAQFRHGPLELAGPGLAAVVIATEPETFDLDLGLAHELVAVGCAVLVVTAGDHGTGRSIPGGALRVDVGDLGGPLAPAASIVPAQLLAWCLATRRGRRPGTYERASKVTTVE
jgi:glucosamine--fructose-6-phosphate aminotransferase (isomerizing)